MRYQGPQAGQEEEDQARNQDPTEFVWRTKCGGVTGCGEGQCKQDAIVDLRVCQQHRLPELIPKVCRL